MMNFNKIFNKYITYDNFKTHKKPKLPHLSRKSSFGKTIRGNQIDHSALLRLKNVSEKANIFRYDS